MENFQWNITSNGTVNENAVTIQNLEYFKYYPEKKKLNKNWITGVKSKYHKIIYIKDGTGFFESDKIAKQGILKETLLVIYPNTWYRCVPDKNFTWEEYSVSFRGNYIEYLVESELFNINQQVYQIGFNYEIDTQFESLVNILKSKQSSTSDVTLQFIFIDILRVLHSNFLINKKQISRKGKMISDVEKYIQKHIRLKLNFNDVAKKFNVSYSLLRKLFKENTNMTLKQYHLELRLNKAKNLIKESDLSFSEIAFQCGFENLQSFSKTFKARENITPSIFRKRKML
ncbi:helix-turn-helix transcriptional regulator [Cellulophaga sp. HaHaR_3_176]|uniref:AraC family transcriptional regulator n=1 Tax=Cellulophaga sp. HaHaR_3_176 TaxID=1942464 RepID=UPI001C1F3AA9|nr:AraC family transcriptional regulator [Cellulophaga sp. HaHaR_3_176]QWX83160.1 helix-turn-helix transcriptional regulator [Cellulophaga sp. HaHaR_3_176]